MRSPSPPQSRAKVSNPLSSFTHFLGWAVTFVFAVCLQPLFAANIIHEFYVPLPEAQVKTALVSIEPASGVVGNTIESVISIVATGVGTVIHYDQWEDGYEVDLNHPVQSTTQIWGDGNDANGIPPGYAHDPASFPAGSVIVLRNQIPLPRNPANLFYDGRDRFGGTKALVVSRASWATTPGTVLCGANEVMATMDYGTNYIAPIGDDVSASSMFEYVGLFVMARDDNTSITIDADGAGAGAATTITLNRGESYLVNGGIKKGATVVATKPIQAHLISGDIGARYESRRFTLYPRDQWSSTMYSPVGTASNGDQSYAFLYNPNGSAITISVTTYSGTSSFSVGANSVYQYTLPQNGGAKFVNSGGSQFFGVVTVGANPSANNVHDWGFTMIPSDSLTSEAVVGWGPGSSDLSQNGSPAWVTPIAATRVYVDYNGDKLGSLTDPIGGKYDAHYDLGALQTQTLYDPDKDQTAMRIYTLDGTQIAAAWGQDPAVAGPSNPFLDCGTTVLPFPVPIMTKTVALYTDTAPTGLSVGDTVEYTVTVDNRGLLPLGNLIVLDPLHPSLAYEAGSTRRDSVTLADNTSGTAFPLDESGYTIPIISRGGTSVFKYRCQITGTGSITNTVNNITYNINANSKVVVQPPAGSNQCGAQFTNSSGTVVSSYVSGTSVYATMTDPDANTNSGTVQTLTVVINDTTNGDAEMITLTETGVNTGIFRNTTGLPTSLSAGGSTMDGTLHVTAGDNLSFTYTDPQYHDTCSGSATISIPTLNKYLYLSDPSQALDRVDPVATSDGTTAQTAVLNPPGVGAGSVTLSPSKDTWMSSTNTTFNYGSSTTLSLDRSGGGVGNERPLLQFDLSSIPAGAVITSAQLTLTKTGGSTGSQNVGVYRVTAAWDEGSQNGAAGTASWSQRQSATNWTTAGGDYNSTAESTVAVAANGAYTWGVTSLVQGWVDGSLANNGVLLGSPDTGGVQSQQFASRENSTTSSRPQLVVTYTSIDVASTSSSSTTNASSLTFSHTPGSGSNRLLLVAVGTGATSNSGNGGTITGVTYNGTAMTLVGSVTPPTNTGTRSYLYSLVNPSAGPANVVVTASAACSMGAGATTFTGVDQTTPLGSYVSASNSGSGTATATVTSAAGEVVYSSATWDEGTSDQTITTDSAQTELWNFSSLNYASPAASTKAGAASVTVTYTAGDGSQEWGLSAVAIKPVSTPATPVSFVQTPTFASAFTMPAGSAPTVTAYYTVSSGSMPASPSVSAVLKKGASTIATSSATGASATTGSGLFTFTFPVLGSAVNCAAGEALTLEITNAQTGVTFTVDYDSSTKPSKITLPTTTVISLNSIGVYDAPYPGGSLITSPTSGTTAYIRAVASDPFGYYDIHHILFDVDGPGASGDFSVSMAGSVATSGALKTFEYPWTVGSTTGVYNIAGTVTEGHESSPAIIDTKSTQVNVTQLDLGTPSTTEFTTGSNGTHTHTYTGGEQVYVRVTDLDQNADALVAETVTVTITTASGDSEVITLTETGVNTGIFVGGIPASTSGGVGTNSGTLHAILGDALNVVYVDPTDSSDTSSDYASVPNTVPAITVNKTRLTPSDGIAVIGESVSYQVQVTNTGNTTLTSVSLTDTYPAAKLSYQSASTTPTTVSSGSLAWTIGTLTQGQSVTITVYFTALATAAPATNSATATATGGVTGSSSANVTITNPHITIVKTRTSAATANIGDNVTFQIVATNDGSSAIASLPVEDTFSAANFDFVSATPAPDSTGSGSLLWLDVTGAGNLAVGNSVTINVTLKAKGAASPASNTATADYTVDVNGDPAPSSNSVATVTLVAAKITGTVYDDLNNSGNFTSGEPGIQGVTVKLYTDPNGDGNPADGTLVAIVTTDVNGAYEFPNLSAQKYVVVESDPAGYGSSGDTQGANDNRIALNVTTLTTWSGNNFFDHLPTAADYAYINGKVWNDANANGVVNGGETGLANIGIDLVQDTNGNGIADVGEPVYLSTLTDSTGAYSFGALPAGNYVVVEQDLFGWISTADSVGANNNQIQVAAVIGTTYNNKDFLDTQLGDITGTVFQDANGNGSYDGGDTLLANIDVLITDSMGNTQTVSTNASGFWTASVPPGTTTVDVQQSDPQFTAVFSLGYTQTAGTDSSTVVAVSGTSTSAGIDGFRQIATVTGHLYIDTNGNGTQNVGEPDLANVDVLITNVDGGTQTVTTNASGNWTATVPPGSTTANVQESDPQYPTGSTQTQGADPTTVTAVANSSVSGGTNGYFLPATISGSVYSDINHNNVGDAPYQGATVKLFTDPNGDGDPADGTQWGSTATTNASGIYTFSNVPPGNYVIVADPITNYVLELDGDTTTPGDDVANASTTDRRIPVGVTGLESDDGNNFLFEHVMAVGNVVFRDANHNGHFDAGEGVSGVKVQLFNSSDVFVTEVTSGAGGIYSITGVSPGSYYVLVPASEFASGKPLFGLISVASTQAGDDNLGEDGIDNAAPATNGIRTALFTLLPNAAPTDATTETGTGKTADNADDANSDLTIDFGYDCPTIAVSPTSLASATVGTAYSDTVSASGGTAPYTFAVTTGTLPAGLSLASGGALTGTPTSTTSQTFTITATDAAGCTGTRSYTLAPTCPGITLSSTPAVLPAAVNGSPYSASIGASGGTAPYTFAIIAGALPLNLTMNSSGAISGTTNVSAGSFNFTVKATDNYGCTGTSVFTISVNCPTITLSPSSLSNGTVGTAYGPVTFSASGGSGAITWQQTGTLPTGVTFNNSTGVLSGTPTSVGSYSISVVGTDANGCSGNVNLSFSTSCPTITVNPASLPDGTVNTAYSQTVSAGGGTSPYTFAVTTGVLPAGLSMSTGGAITGTPTSTTSQTFTITVTDANGCTGARSFTVAPACPAIALSPTSLPNGTVNTAYLQTVTASGGISPYTFAVTTGSLPAGLSMTTGGAISGTPVSTAGETFTITATDANGCTGARSFTVAPACPTISLSPASLPNGTVNAAYSQTVTASGGIAPYTFTVTTGTLPAGLSLAANGDITGTPTSTASHTFVITAKDANNCTGTRSFTVAPACPTISILPASLPDGVVGTPYSQTITASGGIAAYTFAVTAGTLPAGLTLDSDGTLHGTPTSTTSRTFTVTATDANNCAGTRIYTIAPVCPMIDLSPLTLPNGTVNDAYSQTISASGGIAPYTYGVSSGTLPAGLTLATSTGILSGTPTSTTSRTFTVTATDANGCTGSLSFTVQPACPTIAIAPASLANGVVGSAYSDTVSASGGIAPYSFAVTTGTLPDGLNLASNGAITGTPISVASHTFVITATDANGCAAAQSFTVAPVCPAITLASTPAALPNAVNGTAYSASISASGGTAPYTYAITAGALPSALTMNSGGAISGTPNVIAGSFNFTVTATDAHGCEGTSVFTISVDCPTITLSPSSLSNGTVGVAYGPVTFSASGGTGATTWLQTGTLPTGVTFNTGTGVLSGTPTSVGSYSISVVGTDANGCSGSVNLSFSTSCPAITITPVSLPAATVNTPYHQIIGASGGSSPYTFDLLSGTLPDGLTLDSNGTLDGTPVSITSRTFVVRATDVNGCTGTRSFTMVPACPTISISPASLPDGTVNSPYNETVSASGGIAPYTFAVTTGSLPAGLGMANDGTITGTPTSTTSQTFTITATDANGCTGALSFTLTPVCPGISVSPVSLPNGTVNAAYSQTLTASGGLAPYSFTVTTGVLPTGLTLHANGLLDGTPTATTSRTFTVTATDASGCSGSRSFTVAPACPTILLSPSSLPNGVVGTPYSATISANGGVGSYVFGVSGTLPAGLTLHADGTLDGTPTSTTSRTFTIVATDANNCTGSLSYTITPACPAISVSSSNLSNGTVGTPYSASIIALGGTAPYSFATTDLLPPGLTLATNGTLSGTPSAAASRTFLVTVTDANGCTGSQSVTVTNSCPTISVTSATLPQAMVGDSYSATVSASGGTAAYTYAVTGGALPVGLTLGTSGTISGVPTGPIGTSTFTVTATDQFGCSGSGLFAIGVDCNVLTIAPSSLSNGVVGTPYSATLTSPNSVGAVTWALTLGSLPPGLSLNTGTGEISGTPTSTAFSSFSVTATDSNGCTGSTNFVVFVSCPTISVTPNSLPHIPLHTFYSQTLTATGGTAPYTFSLSSWPLPPGLTLSPSGEISGTPTALGSYALTIIVTDAYGCPGSVGYTPVIDGGTVTGHLYVDANDNHQQDVGETNLSNVDVLVTDSTGYISRVTTNAAGNWTAQVAAGAVSAKVDTDDDDFIALVYPGYEVSDGNDPTTGIAVEGSTVALPQVGFFNPAPVSGHVYIDTNGDGMQEFGEPDYSGLQVFVLDAEGTTHTLVTDSSGNWSIMVLPGTTTITLGSVPPGYVHLEGDDPTVITALAGQSNDGGTDGFFVPATIHGHLYVDINGNSMQDSGEPDLENVSVDITDSNGVTQTVSTNSSGIWTATVPPGVTTVNVFENDPDFQMAVPPSYVQTEGDDPTLVAAVAGMNTDAGNDGYFIPAIVSGHLYIDVNGNHLQSFGEPDLPNVTIKVTDSNGVIHTVSTDSNGDWSVSVPPGTTVANVDETDPDFASNLPNYVQTEGDDPTTVTASANATVSAGNDGYFVPAFLTGHLYVDTNSNGHQDSGEPNLANVDVRVTDSSSVVHVVTTNASGDWTASVPGGSTSVKVVTTDPDFPAGVTQSEGNDPTPVTAVTGTTVNGGTDGYKPAGGVFTISGQVRDDFDGNGNFSDPDTPVSGVTMKLWLDVNGDGQLDGGDALMGTTVTNGNGQYTFAGLSNGNYLVQEIDPHPSVSTADVQGDLHDNLVAVTIAGANVTARDFLDAVDPAGYIYDSVTGAIIPGGTVSVSGPGAVTVQMNGSAGQYSFITDGTPGVYTITLTPPPGYRRDPNRPAQAGAFDPTGLPDPVVMGSDEDATNHGYLVNSTAGANVYYTSFDLAPGDPLVINNNFPVILIKPPTYVYWKEVTPGAGGDPGDSNDCDRNNDLIEYALCGDPATGVQTRELWKVVLNGSTGHFDGSFKRPVGISDVIYDVQVIGDLLNSPAGWVSSGIAPVITSNGDGSETVTYPGVDTALPINAQSTAFVRLKVTQTGAPNASASTETFGWTHRNAPNYCETVCNPYLKPAIFSGCVDGVVSNALSVVTSAGTVSVKAQMIGGAQYFIEVVSGDNEGQRWEVDEAASTTNSLAIDLSSALNTKATLPANLAGDVITVRAHWLLGELFDKNVFHGTGNANTADRLLFYNEQTQAFTIRWLFASGLTRSWVQVGDALLTDQSTRIIDNDEGFFVHPRFGAVDLLFYGNVRENAFACPLVQGRTFVGGGWPITQTPASRGMSVAGGFTGSRNPLVADTMEFWSQDASAAGTGYVSHFLLESTTRHQWSPMANASLLNENNVQLLGTLRAVLFRSINGKPDYVMPRAWTP